MNDTVHMARSSARRVLTCDHREFWEREAKETVLVSRFIAIRMSGRIKR